MNADISNFYHIYTNQFFTIDVVYYIKLNYIDYTFFTTTLYKNMATLHNSSTFKIKRKIPKMELSSISPSTVSTDTHNDETNTDNPNMDTQTYESENKPNKHIFTIKRKKTKHKQNSQFHLFVEFCRTNKLPFFQFFDSYSWTGPAIKLNENQFEHIQSLLVLQPFDTITLAGFGFAIIRPSQHLQDDTIYPSDAYESIAFTSKPIIPYNSDTDDDLSDLSGSDVSIEDDFNTEEWIYNTTKFLLDTKTNYLYCPDTLQYLGKKNGEFSVDYDHKEK